MRSHRSVCLMLIATFLACDQYDSPTIPGGGTARPYFGTATVLSVTGACPGSRAGDTLSGVQWAVFVRGTASIVLNKYYDTLEWYSYTGTTDGTRFEARFESRATGSVDDGCYVREARLEGELAANGDFFEARETLEWSGSPGDGVEVVLWRVSR